MKIVVLTGAGVSAESGVPTFRDADGLWEGHRPEEVATPEAFARDPYLVQRFYDERRRFLLRVEPNAAHQALARLCEANLTAYVVTQNIDDLHERGGCDSVVHMHGELRRAWCTACGSRCAWDLDLGDDPPCPSCGHASMRPDVVWFGEMPYRLQEISDRVAECDLFAAIGTSGQVYPAAGFVELARSMGAHTVELNPVCSGRFEEFRGGPATVSVPAWVDEVLAEP